jgi:DNA-binding transcriptional LysR family regulator
VSQSAVTREIRELEDRFELALFDRLPRGVRLTDAGTILLRYAEQIFSLADAAEWELNKCAAILLLQGSFRAGRMSIGVRHSSTRYDSVY